MELDLIVPIVSAVAFALTILFLVWFSVSSIKKWRNKAEPYFAAIEKIYTVNRKRKYIVADDTIICVGWRDIARNQSFSGYYYTKYIGKRHVFCVYISKPCSEHNQNELEKIIKILKSV